VKIGTWNVEYAEGEAKNRLRLQRLHQAQADVWVLTETHDRLDLGPGVTGSARPTGVTLIVAFQVGTPACGRDE
jgi:hypothetical protein